MDSSKEYTFKVSAQEADLILEALAELPLKRVIDLFFKLRQQASQTPNPPAEPTES